jgi:16S rRNA (cytosine967-C5)-methyltransferase
VLERSQLDQRDRALVTELVHGVTRMRRACDWVVDRHVVHRSDLATRTVLRLGAYQILFLRVPAHAAVSATVSAAEADEGFVNACPQGGRRIAATDLAG